jgi:phytoene dehydrogenase-like protein
MAGEDTVRDVAIVGGGLAGLACARALADAGRSVVVLEAEEDVGGRTRTVWHRGRPVDRGFQTLFRAYPETRRLIRAAGIPRRDLRPVSGGAVFHYGDRTEQLHPSPAGLARFGGLSGADRRRLALLAAQAARDPSECLVATRTEAETTEDYLRDSGFGEDAIEGFFRPFFGVVFQDRSLAADPGYFRFLLGIMTRGPAVIPSDGLGMIAEWTAAGVRQKGGEVRLGARVEAIEADESGARARAVLLEGGERIEARLVVLATEAPATARLLGDLDPETTRRLPESAASSVTAAFALDTPLYSGRVIVLDCAPEPDPAHRVDLVCQTSNVTRPGAVEGPHILLAMRVTTGGTPAAGIEEATERLIARWVPGFPFSRVAEHIGTFEERFAQFRPVAGVRVELPGPRTALENVVLAGELTRHPSIEGAVGSGAHAADVAATLLA